MLPWILSFLPVWRFGLRPDFKQEEDLSEYEDFVRPHCEEGPEPETSHLGVINVHVWRRLKTQPIKVSKKTKEHHKSIKA